ncbi:membrane protein insertase YidC [Candidatus Methylacidithermus pantelleriae]|uniref:Membrane protein insertase YidC n=1 Tax=Candidatus Methylacidithermus pantelleriae TaxID=2744239 RepID=A0A8J2BM60_9BACT|nr:membrane protein insertase YidC [Candidatus Methylacidithermus pantelleriae]CAF0701080.1 Membrane protein insertase YidC [Candidatus Methylacidithermus pantelleriae]
MDRSNWTAVLICLLLLLAWQLYLQQRYPTQPAEEPSRALPRKSLAAGPGVSQWPLGHASPETAPSIVLENESIRAVLTSAGGGVLNVELKKHWGNRGHVILNRDARDPVLEMILWKGGEQGPQPLTQFETDQKPGEVIFRTTLPGGILLERHYRLAGDYLIRMEQRLTNPSDHDASVSEWWLNLGIGSPAASQEPPRELAANWFFAKELRVGRASVLDFNPSSFLGVTWREARDRIVSQEGELGWAAVKSQYFLLLLLPDSQFPPDEVLCFRQPIWVFDRKGNRVETLAIQALARFPSLSVPKGKTTAQEFLLYAGPKEYRRLQALGRDAEMAMEFGMWGWIIKPLLGIMNGLHRLIPNYGVVIIVFTLTLKALAWPLQSLANRQMRAMQLLTPKIREIQERYKDDPQKIQSETFKLYKEYGVNPTGGCLPILIQIPIFIGFYRLLQTSVELRHQSFLWIQDLTQPDTVYTLPVVGFDVNVLPLIMAGTQFILARLQPSSGDNPQLKLIQWLPFVFVIFLYNFASALCLYWTVNNICTIFQTYWNLKQPPPTLQKRKKRPGFSALRR